MMGFVLGKNFSYRGRKYRQLDEGQMKVIAM
jgi:hypothetical protein